MSATKEKAVKPLIEKRMKLFGLTLVPKGLEVVEGTSCTLKSLPQGLDVIEPLSPHRLILAHGFRQSCGVLANATRKLDEAGAWDSIMVQLETRPLETVDGTLGAAEMLRSEYIFTNKLSAKLMRRISDDYAHFLSHHDIPVKECPAGLPSSYTLPFYQPGLMPEFLSTHPLTAHMKAVVFELLRPESRYVESRALVNDVEIVESMNCVGYDKLKLSIEMTDSDFAIDPSWVDGLRQDWDQI